MKKYIVVLLLGSMSLSAMEKNDLVEFTFTVTNCSEEENEYSANLSLTYPNIINITARESKISKITETIEAKIERQKKKKITLFYEIKKLHATPCNNYLVSKCYTADGKFHFFSMKTDKSKLPLIPSKPSYTYKNMKSITTTDNAYNAKLKYTFYTKAFKAANKKINDIEK